MSRCRPGASQSRRPADDPALHVERRRGRRRARPVGSWSRASGGISGDRVGGHVRRVGDQQVDPPAQVGRAGRRTGRRCGPAARRPRFVPRARDRHAGRRRRRAPRARPPTYPCRPAIATPDRPRPAAQVHHHADPIRPVVKWHDPTEDSGAFERTIRTSLATSSSVRRRGTNTPGATTIRSPQNSAQPSDRLERLAGHPAGDQRGQGGVGRAASADEQRGLVLGEDGAGRAQPGRQAASVTFGLLRRLPATRTSQTVGQAEDSARCRAR